MQNAPEPALLEYVDYHQRDYSDHREKEREAVNTHYYVWYNLSVQFCVVIGVSELDLGLVEIGIYAVYILGGGVYHICDIIESFIETISLTLSSLQNLIGLAYSSIYSTGCDF